MKCKLECLWTSEECGSQFRLTLFPESKRDQKNVSKMFDANLLSSAHVVEGKFIRAEILFIENPQGDKGSG